MRTVVDTSALIASLNDDDVHNDAATALLGRASEEGALLINDPIYAELSVHFESHETLRAFLDDTGLIRGSLGAETCWLAGERYRAYLQNRGHALACHECGHEATYECPNCGARVRSRQHIQSDFLIGAQAECEADRLLTFDGGFFETYFDVATLSVRA
ncbi:PIN domain-containing protein [Natronomonas sp. EA1]|uniref:PIN domain-containing protein n=1 Tax=Natronomonas sp. EA1 TaxID=3421655 RepID=UPI003EB72B0A